MKTVSLIGRPNVGKSTIFNLLIGEKKAIIDDEPGITRDRIYGIGKFNEKEYLLIDTGGIENKRDSINENIKMQAMLAIDESDLIIFVIDGKTDLNGDDFLIRDLLKKSGKEVLVVVNKLDNEKEMLNQYNYYELGFDNIFAISAVHKKGVKELLELITKDVNESVNTEDNILKFCIIGRPNVGKSSLINALLNEDRVIVSPEAFTTRDAIDTKFRYNNEDYIAIDTAGMRKRGKIYEKIEKYSLLRSLKAIERSDVCVIVIDAIEGIIEQDKHIVACALEFNKAIVLVVNKWDSVKNPDEAIKKWKDDIAKEFQFVPYTKLVFLSALTKKRVQQLMPEVISAYENTTKQIKTSLLNEIVGDATALHESPSFKGKRLKIYFVSQTGSRPPKFTFSVNNKKLIHFSYERYIENKLRESIDFTGTPIQLQFKNKNE